MQNSNGCLNELLTTPSAISLHQILMRLLCDRLLAKGKASSFPFMRALAGGGLSQLV
ncbi:hypothetical protein DUNSADRAFT_6245 [Dunaliella salina]|uniref:Uncharacterized protein n=1 Tax=Dunaliella salina TaxID=3046 RepID=A0ABQ7GNR5_DUNSA|nr:hypothetical protein DUNSADRAFT_6245 [Dunaliella salina]|eukprot:KAF5836233.1 hypothetical protein DUNSADRAFT_6245 [Dunaliella salina]